MAGTGKSSDPGLKDLLNGMLTLLEWQRRLVLDAIKQLPSCAPAPGKPHRPGGPGAERGDPGKTEP